MTDKELFERLEQSSRPEDHKRLEFLKWLEKATTARQDPRRINHAESAKYFFDTTAEANAYFGITDERDEEE